MILEYGHIYVKDIYENTVNEKELVESIKIAIEQNKINSIEQNVVLVDDKDYSLSDIEKRDIHQKVSMYYEKLGLKPDKIYFEKSFSTYYNNIYNFLDKDFLKEEYFRKDKKTVEFLKFDNTKIPLKQIKEDSTKYSCPFLSSLWLLYKKGILSEVENRETLTILSKRYLKVEEQVLAILKKSGYENIEHSNSYIWID